MKKSCVSFVPCVTCVLPLRKKFKKTKLWSFCPLCRLCLASQENYQKSGFVPCVACVSPLRRNLKKQSCGELSLGAKIVQLSSIDLKIRFKSIPTLLHSNVFHIEWSVWVPRSDGRDPLALSRILQNTSSVVFLIH